MEKKGTFCVKILTEKKTFFCLASVRLSKLVGIVYLGFLGFLGFLGVLVSLAKLNMLFISRRKHFFTFSLFNPFTFKGNYSAVLTSQYPLL